MAESVLDHENPLNCPMCPNLFKDPVTTTCGHSFCMNCINKFWDEEADQEANRGVYSCPKCLTAFNKRPALCKTKVLADMLEGMKQEAPAGPGDVTCDVCTGRKLKAIRSCLVCMASYCQTHLRPHYESEAFKKHKLVEASPNLQQQICPQHHKALEVYCHDDRKCVCVVCMVNEHSGHRMVSAADEMAKKQGELKIKNMDFIQKTNDLKEEVQQFKEAVISYKRSAQAAVEHSDNIFSEIICSIQKRQAENNSLSLGILQYNSSRDVNNLTFERAKQSLSAMKSQLDEVCEEHMGRILSKRVIKITHAKKRKREPEMDSVESVVEQLSDNDDDSEGSTDIEDSTDTIHIESSFPDSLESI
ncbi:E3 ubiquitin-protein ligase TRIM47-like isoform X2 [Chanodichthys erythropterus]|uniref:E3 ubiquitin-protein ligase TRIM47-like isoform X2 n=1 Tax=Chanodichthys erythropterus TaxID=933992 RepID=UPI00351EA189